MHVKDARGGRCSTGQPRQGREPKHDDQPDTDREQEAQDAGTARTKHAQKSSRERADGSARTRASKETEAGGAN